MIKQIREKIIDAYYFCWRAWDTVKGIPREIKYFIQRGRRGYADCDCWGIDSYLIKIVPLMLRQMGKYQSGCPFDFFDKENKNNECARWRAELEKMAIGFEAAGHLSNVDYLESGKEDWINNEEKKKEWDEQWETGIESFKKNFFGLWD